MGWNLNKPKTEMFYRNVQCEKSTLKLWALAFISAASHRLSLFLFYTLILTLSFPVWILLALMSDAICFLGLVLLRATVCGPLALQGGLVKLWKWKKTCSKCWQLWCMENIKRAESSLVVRGANMIISLYLRSISAVSSLGLLGCAVDMIVILRLQLPLLPFWLIRYEMLVVGPFV